jgi:hypothetical protein
MRAFLFFLLWVFPLHSNHISWLGDYDKALQQAKKENKPMMALLVKKECPRCNEVIIKYFMNHNHINELNQKYISVIITYEGRLSYPRELFYSSIFPTLFFVKSRDESFLGEAIYFDGLTTLQKIPKHHYKLSD